jgi:acyl-CoA dehydrogenase
LLPEVQSIEKRLKDTPEGAALRHLPQSLSAMQPWLAAAMAAGTVSGQEHNTLLEFARLVDGLIQVDDFPPAAALPGRAFAYSAGGNSPAGGSLAA